MTLKLYRSETPTAYSSANGRSFLRIYAMGERESWSFKNSIFYDRNKSAIRVVDRGGAGIVEWFFDQGKNTNVVLLFVSIFISIVSTIVRT